MSRQFQWQATEFPNLPGKPIQIIWIESNFGLWRESRAQQHKNTIIKRQAQAFPVKFGLMYLKLFIMKNSTSSSDVIAHFSSNWLLLVLFCNRITS